ncbi:MerR family transcriptional regulator [Amycolatopsis sp. H20-H5]|uniref:MerR family transcriptional regulator n=1 Tax=Amycolatopsis sp. H20-H5 TaxID=3046309 RepID=UPI002DBE536C|nr:MerR family transcriptional regulator [Amycolatopsis sp. H20-H5]MEC3975672.1 MerR family transcriptional regulator [Amycolatopsis sp. H20-H5]
MRISELAARTGATARMLRYYEQHGLLRPSRTEGGFRVFGEDDVERVGRIRCLLAAALPIDIIRIVLACTGEREILIPEAEACRPLMDLLEGEFDTLSNRIDELANSREALRGVLDDVRETLARQPHPACP